MTRRIVVSAPAAALVCAAACWALGTVISKELLNTVPPVTFLFLQLLPSAAALWGMILVLKVRLSFGNWLPAILALGLLNPGLSYTLSMLGLAHASASVATLLWAAEPAMIVLLSWLLLRESIRPVVIVLTGTAAAGVALASGVLPSAALMTGNGYGELLILLGVLCCAIYTVVSRRATAVVDPLAIVAVQQSVATIWVAAILPFERAAQSESFFASLDTRTMLGGIASGLLYYAFAYWLYLFGLKAMPASRAGNYFNLIPVFGVIAAYVLLGERLTATQWLGAVGILASVALLQWLTMSNDSTSGTPVIASSASRHTSAIAEINRP